MSFKRFSLAKMSKSTLLVLFAVLTLFLGGAKAEAGAVSWGITYQECFGYDSTAVTQTYLYAYDPSADSVMWQLVTFSEPMFATSIDITSPNHVTYLTSSQLNAYFAQYPNNGTSFPYVIMTSDGPVDFSLPNSACRNQESPTYFAANTGKEVDSYTPGGIERVNIFLGANVSGGGFTQSGWSGLTTSILFNPIAGPITCLFLDCSSAPVVGVSSSFQGNELASCNSSSSGATSCSGSFDVPSTPGNYSIDLVGCYINASNCGSRSVSFTVVGNGACGTTANGKVYTYGSTGYGSDLQCSVGTPSSTAFPTAGASASWTCAGTYGGSTSPTCSASQAAAVVVSPSCGTANGVAYAYGSTNYGSNSQCLVGTPSSTAFPTAGASASWTCTSGSITSGTCSASQNSSTLPAGTLSAGSLDQTKATTIPGESYTISWGSSTGATSCSVTYTGPDGGGTISSNSVTSGSQILTTSAVGTYVAQNTCTSAMGGTATSPSITHTVAAAATFSCTNLPAHASSYSSPDNTGLTANTSYTYSATDTATKCQFTCDNNYTQSGNSCVAVVAPPPAGSVSASVTVTVLAASTCSNGADNPDACTTLNGSCLNGATNPDACTSFEATCSNGADNPDACTTLNGSCLNGATNPDACTSFALSATVLLSASRTSITPGQSSTLTWFSSQDKTSCYPVGGEGVGFSTGGHTSTYPSGGVSVSPSTTSNYQIYCDGVGVRTYSNIVTITVNNPSAVSISANPVRVQSGGSSLITWSGSGVASCSITRNGAAWGTNVSSSGKSDTNITTQNVYTLVSCKNGGGNSITLPTPLPSVTVNVAPIFEAF